MTNWYTILWTILIVLAFAWPSDQAEARSSSHIHASLLATAGERSAREEVEVPIAPDMVLTGVLHIPSTPVPAPAVVLFPGSQGSLNLPGVAEHLASQGIVALDLSKRGVAGSDGHWGDETIERLAGDALAAVEYLRARPEVDAGQVGIVGHSQGGWVAQLAASRNPDVAFIVMLAGPAQAVREQVLADERNHLVGWGVPPHEADGRIEMFNLLLDAALTNPAVCGAQSPHYLCGLIHYDPAEALAGVRSSVLALFGERDPMTPPGLNEARLRASLTGLEDDQLQTRVFPGANHVFWAAETGLRDEYPRLERAYVPGFLDAISSWILELPVSRVAP